MVFFSYVIESSAMGRRPSLRSQQRNEDLFLTNTTPTKLIEPGLFDKYEISVVDFVLFLFIKDFIRTRSDYYNRTQPDFNGVCIKSLILIN